MLIDEISINHGLLDSLYQAGCINKKHMAGIKKHRDDNDKIRQLLDIIQRRTFTQYQLFLGCLRSTYQEHVCDLLERVGGNNVYITIIYMYNVHQFYIRQLFLIK